MDSFGWGDLADYHRVAGGPRRWQHHLRGKNGAPRRNQTGKLSRYARNNENFVFVVDDSPTPIEDLVIEQVGKLVIENQNLAVSTKLERFPKLWNRSGGKATWLEKSVLAGGSSGQQNRILGNSLAG